MNTHISDITCRPITDHWVHSNQVKRLQDHHLLKAQQGGELILPEEARQEHTRLLNAITPQNCWHLWSNKLWMNTKRVIEILVLVPSHKYSVLVPYNCFWCRPIEPEELFSSPTAQWICLLHLSMNSLTRLWVMTYSPSKTVPNIREWVYILIFHHLTCAADINSSLPLGLMKTRLPRCLTLTLYGQKSGTCTCETQ